VEGEMRDGMVVDFADLKSQVRAVFARYDHRHWNDFLDYPSVENICERLAEELAERLAFRFTIRVYEGHGKWAETARDPRTSGGIQA
jgi:6-pyruvoyltetrahydropterin/6-carboxytetrahydropterin synthase